MSYETTIDEPVKVWVMFDRGIFPIAMNWRRKIIQFKKLIFVGSRRVGNIKFLDMVCASETANFELEYNSENHSWKVKKIMPKE